MVSLRPATLADLGLVARWLREPHVARWFLHGSSVEQEVDDLRRSIAGDEPTSVMVALVGDRPVGWAQWYRCDSYAEHARAVGAAPGDAGIDYAVGDPAYVGRGVGTALVGALVEAVRAQDGAAGIVADPEAANVASRKVLEHHGFTLVDVRPVTSEPFPDPVAIYRLAPGRRSGDR